MILFNIIECMKWWINFLLQDDPEAICVCFEQGYACGNDNLTYSTTCELSDTVHRAKSSSLSLLHLGPCPKRPEIQPPKRIVITESVGHMVSVNCDVKGFPLPDISWRYRSNDGRIFIELPGEEKAPFFYWNLFWRQRNVRRVDQCRLSSIPPANPYRICANAYSCWLCIET